MMFSLARQYRFSLDTPFRDLPAAVVEILFYGTKGERFPLLLPEGRRRVTGRCGKLFRFDGIINRHRAPLPPLPPPEGRPHLDGGVPEEGDGGARLSRLRGHAATSRSGCWSPSGAGTSTSSASCRLGAARVPGRAAAPARRQAQAGEQIAHEILARLDLLLGIGLDYLNLNRRAATLSGGESQRIRLSTQIGSGLMGMLYVLDEPRSGSTQATT